MKSRSTLVAVCIALALTLAGPARPCTTFCFESEGQWIFGRNLDWDVEEGLVVVNKRGVRKTAMACDNPVHWVSRYGSVTFNQYGRENPMGGMNEAGLVVECLWLRSTSYPAPDPRPELGVLQWIQYQLDTADSVAEVVASDAKIRIGPPTSSPLHFLVCDRHGHCAGIEFLEGGMVAHTGSDMPLTCLTNNTYDRAVSFWETCDGGEQSEAFRNAQTYSLKRFFWAAQGVRNYRPDASGSAIDYAFAVLDRVSVSRTQWRIVYDVARGRIHYLTRSQPARRFIDLRNFDFDCASPVMILDLGDAGAGDVSERFGAYSYAANFDLIKLTYRKTDFLQHLSEDVLAGVARYPETLPCVE